MEVFIRPGRNERNWIHRSAFTVPGVIRTAPDEIEHTERWERTHAKATSDKPLARLAGKPVRLRFVMEDADLYSLRFR